MKKKQSQFKSVLYQLKFDHLLRNELAENVHEEHLQAGMKKKQSQFNGA